MRPYHSSQVEAGGGDATAKRRKMATASNSLILFDTSSLLPPPLAAVSADASGVSQQRLLESMDLAKEASPESVVRAVAFALGCAIGLPLQLPWARRVLQRTATRLPGYTTSPGHHVYDALVQGQAQSLLAFARSIKSSDHEHVGVLLQSHCGALATGPTAEVGLAALLVSNREFAECLVTRLRSTMNALNTSQTHALWQDLLALLRLAVTVLSRPDECAPTSDTVVALCKVCAGILADESLPREAATVAAVGLVASTLLVCNGDSARSAAIYERYFFGNHPLDNDNAARNLFNNDSAARDLFDTLHIKAVGDLEDPLDIATLVRAVIVHDPRALLATNDHRCVPLLWSHVAPLVDKINDPHADRHLRTYRVTLALYADLLTMLASLVNKAPTAAEAHALLTCTTVDKTWFTTEVLQRALSLCDSPVDGVREQCRETIVALLQLVALWRHHDEAHAQSELEQIHARVLATSWLVKPRYTILSLLVAVLPAHVFLRDRTLILDMFRAAGSSLLRSTVTDLYATLVRRHSSCDDWFRTWCAPAGTLVDLVTLPTPPAAFSSLLTLDDYLMIQRGLLDRFFIAPIKLFGLAALERLVNAASTRFAAHPMAVTRLCIILFTLARTHGVSFDTPFDRLLTTPDDDPNDEDENETVAQQEDELDANALSPSPAPPSPSPDWLAFVRRANIIWLAMGCNDTTLRGETALLLATAHRDTDPLGTREAEFLFSLVEHACHGCGSTSSHRQQLAGVFKRTFQRIASSTHQALRHMSRSREYNKTRGNDIVQRSRSLFHRLVSVAVDACAPTAPFTRRLVGILILRAACDLFFGSSGSSSGVATTSAALGVDEALRSPLAIHRLLSALEDGFEAVRVSSYDTLRLYYTKELDPTTATTWSLVERAQSLFTGLRGLDCAAAAAYASLAFASAPNTPLLSLEHWLSLAGTFSTAESGARALFRGHGPLMCLRRCVEDSRDTIVKSSSSSAESHAAWRDTIVRILHHCEAVITSVDHLMTHHPTVRDRVVPSFADIYRVASELMATESETENDSQLDGALNDEQQQVHNVLWTTVTEAGALLAAVLQHVPIGESRLISVDEAAAVAQLVGTTVSRSRHKGLVERLAVSWETICTVFHRDKQLASFPALWVNAAIDEQVSLAKVSVTRRGAGLPLMLLGCLASEPRAGTQPLVRASLNRLLDVASEPVAHSDDVHNADLVQVRAMFSALRVFRDTRLVGITIDSAGRALELAIRGFASPVFAVRNACTYLYGAAMTRACGARETPSVAANDFFARHRSLLLLLETTLERTTGDGERADAVAALTVLVRLAPLVAPAVQIDFNRLIGLVRAQCIESRQLHARILAARALCNILSRDQVTSELLQSLSEASLAHQNALHGRLALVRAVAHQRSDYAHCTPQLVRVLTTTVERFACDRNPCSLTRALALEAGQAMWRVAVSGGTCDDAEPLRQALVAASSDVVHQQIGISGVDRVAGASMLREQAALCCLECAASTAEMLECCEQLVAEAVDARVVASALRRLILVPQAWTTPTGQRTLRCVLSGTLRARCVPTDDPDLRLSEREILLEVAPESLRADNLGNDEALLVAVAERWREEIELLPAAAALLLYGGIVRGPHLTPKWIALVASLAVPSAPLESRVVAARAILAFARRFGGNTVGGRHGLSPDHTGQLWSSLVWLVQEEDPEVREPACCAVAAAMAMQVESLEPSRCLRLCVRMVAERSPSALVALIEGPRDERDVDALFPVSADSWSRRFFDEEPANALLDTMLTSELALEAALALVEDGSAAVHTMMVSHLTPCCLRALSRLDTLCLRSTGLVLSRSQTGPYVAKGRCALLRRALLIVTRLAPISLTSNKAHRALADSLPDRLLQRIPDPVLRGMCDAL